MVATIGLVPGLTAVNDAMLPVPVAARPISGWSLLHEILASVPVNRTAFVAKPLHTAWSEGTSAKAVGFTTS